MDQCNPTYDLLTTDQARHVLAAKFPNAEVPLDIHPGMEPLISWLVGHEDALRDGGLLSCSVDQPKGDTPDAPACEGEGCGEPEGDSDENGEEDESEEDDDPEPASTPELETEEPPSVEPVNDEPTLVSVEFLKEILMSASSAKDLLAANPTLASAGLNRRSIAMVIAAAVAMVEEATS